MPKTRSIPVQETNPDGSISIKVKKQVDLFHFIVEKVEEIPPVVPEGTQAKAVLEMGNCLGIEFNFCLFKEKYWCPRKNFEKIYPGIARQFNNLCEEYVEEFDCYWIEEGIDYMVCNIDEFGEKYGWKIFPPAQRGGEAILLSVEGIIKLLSRSSKMKTVLFWLIKKFMDYQILKFEVESFWRKLQRTESPPELYYLCAAARHLNIDKLDPQKWIGKFRGDLVIDDKFLVMIKGYKYHSGKEKVYKDTIRERYIQQHGYVCITFWAYEIFQDVEKCVNETLDIINKHAHLFKDSHKKNKLTR